MNILIYVIAFLMLLGTITYTRLAQYQTFSTLKHSYYTYSQEISFKILEESAEKVYDSFHVRTGSQQQNDNPRTKIQGLSRLSIHLLLNADKRTAQPQLYQQQRAIFKKLMSHLFSKHPVIANALEKQPTLFDDVLDAIQEAAATQPETLKGVHATELSKLKLPSEQLHFYLYLMLTGTPKTLPQTQIEPTYEDADDEEIASIENEEINAFPGFDSLLNYISIRDVQKIRVFLASPALLSAIFDDTNTVEKIIETRAELFREAKRTKGPEILKELSIRFFQEFGHSAHAQEFQSILDFNVTRSNPTNYE